MKKSTRFLTLLIAVLTALSLLSVCVTADEGSYDHAYDRFASAGQKTYDIRATYTPITIDGQISEGEWNCDPIVLTEEQIKEYWLDWTSTSFPTDELHEVIPWKMVIYVTYNAEGLYTAVEVTEPSHFVPDGIVTNLWKYDCLCVDVSMDAYDYIATKEFTEEDMLDHTRTVYGLVEPEGEEPWSLGYVDVTASYSEYYVDLNPLENGNYCVGRQEQVTTYEIFQTWMDLYGQEEAPAEVYMNFQIHVADERYLSYVTEGYGYCLGGIRYACLLDEDLKEVYDSTVSTIYNIYKLTDYQTVNNGGTPPETETDTQPDEQPTETLPETETEPNETTVVTDTNETTAAGTVTEKTTDPSATEAKSDEVGTDSGSTGGCSSVIGSSAILLLAATAVVAFRKKKTR